jgi:hypothetical protein
MAINPNVDFVSGAILTAAQQNRFPRGVMAVGNKTVVQNGITTETEIVSSGSFTAVANRYYRITFTSYNNYKGTTGDVVWRIRETDTSGAQIAQTNRNVTGATQCGATVIGVTTFTAGAKTVIGSILVSTGNLASEPSATQPAQIIVEDIGPA